MSASLENTAEEILRHNGRSFNFARVFLRASHGQRAARLYAFCRYIDDIADDASDVHKAKKILEEIKSQLIVNLPPSTCVADFIKLAQDTNIDPALAIELIDGVASDLGTVAFETTAELIQYAYRVAGTVGLMMCRVLEVDNPRAMPFAIDLGVAMQLTNIARDIREDALNGRRYVPATWLAGVTAADIANPNTSLKPRLQAASQRLIQLAELYYESAYNGFGFLPGRSRLAILIAARVYRQIGLKLKRRDFAAWRGRTVVSTAEKIMVAGAAITAYLTELRLHRCSLEHNAELHVSLQGFAGTNQLVK